MVAIRKAYDRSNSELLHFRPVNAASHLLKPYDARLMRCYPVSGRVNSAANDADCSAPVETAEAQARLFS